MSEIITDEEINKFTVEALELLSVAETALLKVESGSNFQETYPIFFRTLHSIKGGAGMMNLLPLRDHVHTLENDLKNHENSPNVTQDQLELFLKGIDATRMLLIGKTAQIQKEENITTKMEIQTTTDELRKNNYLNKKSDFVLKWDEHYITNNQATDIAHEAIFSEFQKIQETTRTLPNTAHHALHFAILIGELVGAIRLHMRIEEAKSGKVKSKLETTDLHEQHHQVFLYQITQYEQDLANGDIFPSGTIVAALAILFKRHVETEVQILKNKP